MADLRGGSTVGGRPILGKEARDNYIGMVLGNKIKESTIVQSGENIKVKGKMIVDGISTLNQDPIITLALGDADTGFDWTSDGNFFIKANGVNVGKIHNNQMDLWKPLVMNNNNITGVSVLMGQFGKIAHSYDEWLRINDDGSHSSGTYFGSTIVRTDGELQVGSGGTVFRASSGALTWNNQSLDARYLGISAKASDSDKLDGLDSASFMRADADDVITGKISPATANRNAGMYGIYEASKIGHIWSIGTGYSIPADGTTFGTLYGLAYKHTTNTTGGTMGGGHQVVWVVNGTPKVSLGETGIWTSGTIVSTGAITSSGGIQVNGQWTDNRLTTGNKQMMNVESSTGAKIYMGNPATPLTLEGTAVTVTSSLAVTGGMTSNTGGTNYIWQKVVIPDNYRSIRFESTTKQHISWTVDVNSDKSFEVYREAVNGFTGKQLFRVDMEGNGFLQNGNPILRGGEVVTYNGDLNTLVSTGFFRCNGTTGATNTPPIVSNPDKWFYLVVMRHDDSWIQQTAIEYSSGMKYTRQKASGTWQPWKVDLGEDSSGALGNGTYYRFSNGIQICWHRDVNPASWFTYGSANMAGGTYFYTSNQWTFPASFLSGSWVTVLAGGDIPVAAPETHTAWHRDHTLCDTEGGAFGIDYRTSGTQRQELWFAIGKWK